MSAPFDPYLQWLGIEGEGIPSHYELFGLRANESDTTVVEEATNVRLARLRAIDPGEHREVWEQLVAYLEEVRAVLLDPAAKAEYDATLPDPPRVPPAKPSKPAPKSSGTAPASAPPTVSLAVPPGMPSEPTPEPPPSVPPAAAPVSPPGGLPVGTPVSAPVTAPSGLPVGIPVAQGLPDAKNSGDLDAIGVDVTSSGRSRGRLPLKPRKRGLSNNQITVLFIVGILILGGLAYGVLQIQQRDQQKRMPKQKPTAAPVVPKKKTKTHPLNRESVVPLERRTLASLVGKADPDAKTAISGTGVESPAVPTEDKPDKTTTPTNPTSPEGAPSQEKVGSNGDDASESAVRFQTLLSEARRLIGARDIPQATVELEKARKLVDTPKRNAQWDQVCSMRDLVRSFWSGIRDELDRRRNEPMSVSFDGGAAQFVVVECDRNQLVIRKEGETLTYAVEEMPHNLVRLMAGKLLEQSTDTMAMTGAFIAMEPEGDREDARRLLEKAAEARDDLKRVLPELDVPRSETPAEARFPLPNDEKQVAQTQFAVKRQFKEKYTAAKSGPKQTALSRTLLEAAEAEKNDRTRQYVLFEDAVRFAVAGGSAKDALRAVDAMGRVFAVDTLEKKTSVLTAVAQRAVGSRSHRELVPLALELAGEAAEAGRKNQFERIIETAKDSARKTGSAGTMKEVRDLENRVKKS